VDRRAAWLPVEKFARSANSPFVIKLADDDQRTVRRSCTEIAGPEIGSSATALPSGIAVNIVPSTTIGVADQRPCKPAVVNFQTGCNRLTFAGVTCAAGEKRLNP